VWDKPAQPYLVSVDDHDDTGAAYCSASRYMQWRYSWPTQRLADIVAKHGKSVACEGSFGGSLKKITVLSRFECGRVQRLRVSGTRNTADFCGDRTRFALRRNTSGLPILPGSRFKVVSQGSKSVVLSGSGYGHGVGMCQMGALGRARAGQSFSQILTAYYSGARIARVVTGPPRVTR
jgi:stage II sporulation protein D